MVIFMLFLLFEHIGFHETLNLYVNKEARTKLNVRYYMFNKLTLLYIHYWFGSFENWILHKYSMRFKDFYMILAKSINSNI